MQTFQADLAIVGAGGAGLRAANCRRAGKSKCKIALISKVYPMRSHTVAAEGAPPLSRRIMTASNITFTIQ